MGVTGCCCRKSRFIDVDAFVEAGSTDGDSTDFGTSSACCSFDNSCYSRGNSSGSSGTCRIGPDSSRGAFVVGTMIYKINYIISYWNVLLLIVTVHIIWVV